MTRLTRAPRPVSPLDAYAAARAAYERVRLAEPAERWEAGVAMVAAWKRLTKDEKAAVLEGNRKPVEVPCE